MSDEYVQDLGPLKVTAAVNIMPGSLRTSESLKDVKWSGSICARPFPPGGGGVGRGESDFLPCRPCRVSRCAGAWNRLAT